MDLQHAVMVWLGSTLVLFAMMKNETEFNIHAISEPSIRGWSLELFIYGMQKWHCGLLAGIAHALRPGRAAGAHRIQPQLWISHVCALAWWQRSLIHPEKQCSDRTADKSISVLPSPANAAGLRVLGAAILLRSKGGLSEHSSPCQPKQSSNTFMLSLPKNTASSSLACLHLVKSS